MLRGMAWFHTSSDRFDLLDVVSIELGHGEASIRAEVHADGKLRLVFGSGEEFMGYHRELPARVSAAARNVLDVAAPLVGFLPRTEKEYPPGPGTVRMELCTSQAAYADASRIPALEQGASPVAPLWRAFSDLLGPLITVLFKAPAAPGHARDASPALIRARGLWSAPRGV